MKSIKNLAVGMCVLFLLCSALNVNLSAGQSDEEKKMAELFMKYGTPGENHKYLEYFTGNWEVTTRMWMAPGTEPQVTKGDNTSEMILGGRYLKAEYKGTMMGMPFEGMSITGYDNFKKEFVTIWIDTAGTGIYQTSGTLDKSGKIRTETGLWDDYMSGGKSKVKWITKIVDDNNFTFTMYGQDPKTGKEIMTGEILYKRGK